MSERSQQGVPTSDEKRTTPQCIHGKTAIERCVPCEMEAEKGNGTGFVAQTSNPSNDEALIKALRDNAWEYQIPGELILQAANRIEQLRGIKPELPPRPPDDGDQALPRYGIRWNDKGEPLSVPMVDGYWTPWHLADRAAHETCEPLTSIPARPYPGDEEAIRQYGKSFGCRCVARRSDDNHQDNCEFWQGVLAARKQWMDRNVVAWSCSEEAAGRKRCSQWCGRPQFCTASGTDRRRSEKANVGQCGICGNHHSGDC